MSSVVYAGPPGSGKTFLAVRDVLRDRRVIVSNIPIFTDTDQKEYIQGLAEWKEVGDFINKRCVVILGDELHLWLAARDAMTNKSAVPATRWLTRHRHYDSRVVSTIQNLAYVDVNFRRLIDYVVMPQCISIPFLGWIFPNCRRKPMVCHYCNKLRDDTALDMSTWYGKWFGFGTILKCDFFTPSVIGKDEKQVSSEENEAMAFDRQYILWDQKMADRYGSAFFNEHKEVPDGVEEMRCLDANHAMAV